MHEIPGSISQGRDVEPADAAGAAGGGAVFLPLVPQLLRKIPVHLGRVGSLANPRRVRFHLHTRIGCF